MRSERMALYQAAIVVFVLSACVDEQTPPSGSGADSDPGSPVQEFSIDTGDVTLYARSVGGSGSFLVAVPGAAVTSNYLWTLPDLPGSIIAGPKRTFVSYDRRGVGRSTVPHSNDYSFPRQVEDLEALRSFFEADKLHLLGHSWGGAIIMAYAIEHPDHVGSLILLGGAPPTSDSLLAGLARHEARIAELQKAGRVPDPVPPPDLENDNMDAVVAATFPSYFSDPDFQPPPELAGTKVSPSIYQASVVAQIPFDMSPELRRLELPVLLLYGQDDPFGIEWAREVEAAFAAADVRLVLLPDCGHFYHECWDETRKALEPFLDAVAGPRE